MNYLSLLLDGQVQVGLHFLYIQSVFLYVLPRLSISTDLISTIK